MNHTFSRQISFPDVVPPVLSAVMAMTFLWHRTAAGACGGLFMVIFTVFVIERLLHTEYIFSNGKLFIKRGRFSRIQIICIDEITRVEVMSRMFVRYVLIEYGAGHCMSVQPDNIKAFIDEIRKRQE